MRAVKLPPQNSAEAKELGGGRAARKRPIGETIISGGMNKTPTDYSFTLFHLAGFQGFDLAHLCRELI
ncbi:hypothetical protein CN505_17870 [Bacillus cereus]|nr:hypothetical protein CN509_13525 [Bacillus cereus]PET03204.1 hypothetical protein CN505_17870 [Bacillus cereus]